jgi:DNA-binding NarL/FixJ family response regulator
VSGPVQPRVLIVDDDPTIRRALGGLLTEFGMTVVGDAADGRAGIELACRLVPDVVVMDVRMPVLGGIEATRALTIMLPSVRVVLCTAYDDALVSEHGLLAGAAAVVAKGEHPARLVETIERAWSVQDPA